MASRAKKKWRYRQQDTHRELKRKLVSTEALHGKEVIISDSHNEEKMSAVLLDFVAPYTARAESDEEFRMAIEMGLVAWNIALLPADFREERLDQLLEDALPTGAQEFREFVDEMIERKEKYFADCQRLILAHHLTMTRQRRHLSVVSTTS